MNKIIIVIVIAIGAWFAYEQFKAAEKKPDNAVTKYADTLKTDRDKAEEAKDTANLAVLRSAVIQFHGSQGRYPESLQELITKGYVDRVDQNIQYNKETGEIKY
jgi:predicted negative regulator of RcsB-dependent stress response